MQYRDNHPKLIGEVQQLLRSIGKPYVIENVEGARFALKHPVMLCGTMFGLPIRRHRFFEIKPVPFALLPRCDHSREIVYITGTPRPKTGPRKDPSADVKRSALGTPWMTIVDMDEAVPPVFTEWIGRQLLSGMSPQIAA
jgi:DNA (cytosine-5)-methyltransferase 1